MSDAPLAYHSAARRNSADACKDMSDVRYEVDRLDRLLVEILAERTTFMGAAARIKESRDAVHDAERIEDVVSKVRAHAEQAGLPTEIAEPLWRLLIEKSIAYEYDRWDDLKG